MSSSRSRVTPIPYSLLPLPPFPSIIPSEKVTMSSSVTVIKPRRMGPPKVSLLPPPPPPSRDVSRMAISDSGTQWFAGDEPPPQPPFMEKDDLDDPYGLGFDSRLSRPPRGIDLLLDNPMHQAVTCKSQDMLLRVISATRGPRLRQMLVSLDPMGMTPLMLACQLGSLPMVQILLGVGASAGSTSCSSRRTPAICAAIGGNVQIMQKLDQLEGGVDWFKRDNSGCNALHHAITAGSLGAVKYLFTTLGLQYLEDKDGFGWTPLLRAVIVGSSEELIEYLLELGADPNAMDKLQMKSCLIAAAGRNARLGVVKLLLLFGADPLWTNSLKENALSVATDKAVKALLREKMLERELNPWMTPSRILPPMSNRRCVQPPLKSIRDQGQGQGSVLQIQTGRPSSVLPQAEVDAEVRASVNAAIHLQGQKVRPGTAAATGTPTGVKAAAAVARASRALDLAQSRNNDTRFPSKDLGGGGHQGQGHVRRRN